MAKAARNTIKLPQANVTTGQGVQTGSDFSTSSLRGNENIPVRTVLILDVGNLPANDVRAAIKTVTNSYQHNQHPHYVVASRNGKLTHDILFEEEFLKVVHELCEIKDGVICMKNGSQDVEVFRKIL